MKFIFERDYDGREIQSIQTYCILNKIPYIVSDSYKDGYIPVGCVEWIENIIGNTIPDFYPYFLKEYFHRDIWYRNTFEELIEDVCGEREDFFIKASDSYKRFDAGKVSEFPNCQIRPIDRSYFEYLKGPYACSEIVEFKNEWRYYVANGEVICGWWYKGEFDSGEGPPLDIKFPKTFCGAVDFGELYCGKLALVEVQHPYAIGWYGEDVNQYVKFIVEGWKSLTAQSG